jgi:Fe2+ or Zn2+ uptake regulation protein
MSRTIHPLGLPETETSPVRPETAPRQRSRACHIVCTDCGNAADVALDVLLDAMPAAELHLRCLDCLGHAVTVTETTLVAH